MKHETKLYILFATAAAILLINVFLAYQAYKVRNCAEFSYSFVPYLMMTLYLLPVINMLLTLLLS